MIKSMTGIADDDDYESWHQYRPNLLLPAWKQ